MPLTPQQLPCSDFPAQLHAAPHADTTISTEEPAANNASFGDPMTRLLFGTPGDFLDTHQGALLCVILLAIAAGSAL